MAPPRPTVFIIDDDESVRRAVGRLIRSAGLHAETFATAEDYLRAAETPGPACLVLDVHLPGLSGPELRARLDAEGRGVPVVFISAFDDEPTRDQALRDGAVAFLRKPFDDRSLLDAVGQALCVPKLGGP
jgi:FixJ family two-component response regulator